MFDNVRLNDVERSQLHVIIRTEGFKILKRIMEDEVEKFKVRLLNASGTKPEEVLEAHNRAKAAAQFCVGVFNTINAEMEYLSKSPKASDEPEDVTQELLGG